MEFTTLEDMDGIERGTVSGQVKALMVAIALLGVSILLAVAYFAFRPDFEITYDKVSDITQVQGSTVDADTDTEISDIIHSYFNVLENESSYTILNSFCANGSDFARSIEENRNKMVTSYDEYDSYVRGMSKLGAANGVSSLNDIIEKDGTYYVYMTLSTPDVVSYFYTYSEDLAQYFTTKGVTQENLMSHAYKLMDTYEFPTEDRNVVLEMVQSSDGSFMLVNDGAILEMVEISYDTAVNEVVRVAKLSMVKEQY